MTITRSVGTWSSLAVLLATALSALGQERLKLGDPELPPAAMTPDPAKPASISRGGRAALVSDLVLQGLLVGDFTEEVIGIIPSKQALSASAFVNFQQSFNGTMGILTPVLEAAPLVSSGTALALNWRSWRAPPFWLIVASAALDAAVIVVTVVNDGINSQVDSWNPASPPANWASVRDQWTTVATTRTVLAYGSLGCKVAADILDW